MSGTEWLRAMARGPLPAMPRGQQKDDDGLYRVPDVQPTDPAREFARVTTPVGPDPVTKIERTGGRSKRARGSGPLLVDSEHEQVHGGSWDASDTGAVPWYVPEGAVFDAEMAKGYRGHSGQYVPGLHPRIGSFRHVDRAHLTYDEWDDLHAPHQEEVEDWAEHWITPVRPTVRAGGWVDQDWTGHHEAEVDEWVDHLIAYAEWAFTPAGDPIQERIDKLWAAFNGGDVPSGAAYAAQRRRDLEEQEARRAELERVILHNAAMTRKQLRTGSGPAPARQAAKEALPGPDGSSPLPDHGRNGGPPLRTGGLPVDDAGKIEPDAWEAFWA